MTLRSIMISVSALVILTSAGLAQTNPLDARIRLARTYEKNGRLEEAAQIYLELHTADPQNIVFFDGLRRVYIQLKRYDEAIGLVRSRLDESLDDVVLRSQLASILYKAGREQEAYNEWERAIVVDSTNPGYYRTVAGSLIENRLLDRTANTYRRARENCGNPDLFTIELAQLLGATMDYRGATKEYARWLRQHPTQLSFVQSRMGNITGKPEGRQSAVAEVQAALDDAETVPLLELLAWLHLEGKRYSEAYQVYRSIDNQTEANGTRVYAFAEQAFREDAFEVAAEAYLEAIRIPVTNGRLPAAKYGYASCLKEMIQPGSSFVPQNGDPATEAISRFKEIILEYPRTEYAAKSYYQIGVINYEYFFNLDEALASFMAVENELDARNSLSYFVALKTGEVYTAMGDTSSAGMIFRDVMNAQTAIPDQQDEATFRLAELEYFGGKFSSATGLLEGLTLNLRVDYANDALELLSFLQENMQTSEPALKKLGRADFLARQKRNHEAVPMYLQIPERYPSALLAGDALLRAGYLQAETGQPDEAVRTLERIVTDFSESSIALDKAQFAIGSIYQYNLNDHPSAISAYESLLVNFPQSLHTTEARKRIRELRGESL